MNEKKKETLEEAEKRVFDYDPTDEELNRLYGKEFNEWCDNYFKNKK